MMRSLLLIVVLLACLVSPSKAADMRPLIGTWTYAHVSRPFHLTFNGDYSYQVDWNADGTVDIFGLYEFWEGRLVMWDEYPPNNTLCVAPGVYMYSWDGRQLTFQLQSDECAPRIATLKESFKRISR